MLYNVIEISESIGLSKQSIYLKLKLKNIQEHVIKKQGVTYVDEVGFKLIQDSKKVDTETLKDLNSVDKKNILNEYIVKDTEVLNLDKKLFDLLNNQLKVKDLQLNENTLQFKEKDIQIHELNERLKQEQDLNKNNQVLQLRPQQDIKQLEEHFQDLDTKLMEIKEQMNVKEQPQEGFFKKIFKR